ncbi:TIGR04222 domain-containing membrane protein, partial [bacterium]|nr:TIGR04222 domain-containing membrane protein [bacterium]
MHGPEFLGFYAATVGLVSIVSLVVRWALRPPYDAPLLSGYNLDAYEVAFLSGGAKTAVDAAIASLVHRKLLKVSPTTRRLEPAGKP